MPSLSEIKTRAGAAIRVDQVTYIELTHRGGVSTLRFGLPSGDYVLRAKLAGAAGDLNEFFNLVWNQKFEDVLWKIPAEVEFDLAKGNNN